MGTPSGIRQGVGFRHCQVLKLNASGYPVGAGTTAYAGVTVSGAKSLTINDPEPRQIVHLGDDTVQQLDVLPPTEPVSGELNVSKVNDVVDQVLSPAKQVTVGESVMFPIGHDQRGNENQVVILAYRQTLEADQSDGDFGSRQWEYRLFPKALVVSRENTWDENPETRVYSMKPQFVTRHAWGTTFGTAENIGRAQGFRGVAEGKPQLVGFLGNNTATQFALPATTPALSTAKMVVWKDGVLQTSGAATVTTAQITFTTAPTTSANIVCFYEA